MQHYDLAIVGTGSGNSLIDKRFAGWKVALIEKGTFGGTCLNVGCIPTKMFVHTADLAAAPLASDRLGVDLIQEKVHWPEIRDRIFGRIDPIAEGGRRHRVEDNQHVTVYTGQARFTGRKQLAVDTASGTEELTADRIVLAAGGRPMAPEIPGMDSVSYHTSDTVMRLDELPSRMIILGTGFIGAEFAHVFSALGVDVTQVGRSSRLLRNHDTAISERFTELAPQRWNVLLNRESVRVEQNEGVIRLHLLGPEGPEVLEAEELLVAVGRRPNSDLLDTAAGGIDTDSAGKVVVDITQQTTVEGVWALGDLSSPHELKHVANHETRVVQHNLLHPDSLTTSDHRFVPHAVFTSPQIASVGLTEDEAHQRGIPHVTAVQDYADIAYGWAMEDTSGFAKLLADPTSGRLLGAHILGPQAPTLLQPLIQAMHYDIDVRGMARAQYWIHPAMPELVENALLKLEAELG